MATEDPHDAPRLVGAGMTVSVRGGNIAIDRTDGQGPTVVLLHYWGGAARTWDRVCEGLVDVPTLRYDQRGWGRSAELPAPYGLDALAEDLLEVVSRQVTGDWILVGHSMSGKVAMLAAARTPSGLRSLVLVAPAPPKPNPAVTPDVQAQLATAYASPESVRAVLVTGRPLPEDEIVRIVEDSLAGTPEAVQEWPARGITADITAQASTLNLPITVIVGDEDVVEPPATLRTNLAEIVPNVSITVLPGVGHLVPLEAPQAITRAIRASLISSA